MLEALLLDVAIVSQRLKTEISLTGFKPGFWGFPLRALREQHFAAAVVNQWDAFGEPR